MPELRDGPNNVTLYEQSPIRVMHLLKNPTPPKPNESKPNESFAGLIQQLVDRANLGSTFMRRLAERSYGLRNGFADWQTTKGQDDVTLGRALLATAIVNLAKDVFSSSASPEQVQQWAKQNRAHWHGQVQRWQPDVIVCGGTCDQVWRALNEPQWQRASTGMGYFFDSAPKGAVYLDAPHPSVRWPASMVHTYLMVSAREVLGTCGSIQP